MKKYVIASCLAVSCLAVLASENNAFANDPQAFHGYGWFAGRRLNSAPWIHQHGPLYSYGPYVGQGYRTMFVPDPHFGTYIPAFPASYYPYSSGYEYGFGYYNNGGYPITPAGPTPEPIHPPAANPAPEPIPAPKTTDAQPSYTSEATPGILSSLRARLRR
jgi:hypothetical protein